MDKIKKIFKVKWILAVWVPFLLAILFILLAFISATTSSDGCDDKNKNSNGDPTNNPANLAKKEDIAKEGYQHLIDHGNSSIGAAAFLGYYDKEAGIDPSQIESVYDEDYNAAGTKKQTAVDGDFAWDNYGGQNGILDFGSYVSQVGANASAYEGGDGHKYGAIGMMSWTGPRALNYLNWLGGPDSDETKDKWADLGNQVDYLYDTNAPEFNDHKDQLLAIGTATDLDTAVSSVLAFGGAQDGKDVEVAENAQYWYSKLAADDDVSGDQDTLLGGGAAGGQAGSNSQDSAESIGCGGADGEGLLPVHSKYRVTGGWPDYGGTAGGYHGGVDFQPVNHSDDLSNEDGNVYAVTNGTVTKIDHGAVEGWFITIKGTDGTTSYYGHAPSKDAFQVQVGDTVTAGQHISHIGQTGQATGVHVHFQLTDSSGKNTNPGTYLQNFPKELLQGEAAVIPGDKIYEPK